MKNKVNERKGGGVIETSNVMDTKEVLHELTKIERQITKFKSLVKRHDVDRDWVKEIWGED
jgi:hypothetical protein